MTLEDFFALHNITEADFHPNRTTTTTNEPTSRTDDLDDIREALRILLGGDTE